MPRSRSTWPMPSCRATQKGARVAYQAAIDAGGRRFLSVMKGWRSLRLLENADTTKYLDAAAQAGSRSAPVYFASAEDLPTERMIALLKKAETLNPRWAEPVFRQAQETEDKGGTRGADQESYRDQSA